MDIQKTIKDAIVKSGKTRYRIYIESGIPESILFKIYHDTGSIDAKTASILLSYFNYELREKEGK